MTNKDIETLYEQILSKLPLEKLLLEYARELYKEPLSWETQADYEKYGDMFIDVEAKVDVQKYPLVKIGEDK